MEGIREDWKCDGRERGLQMEGNIYLLHLHTAGTKISPVGTAFLRIGQNTVAHVQNPRLQDCKVDARQTLKLRCVSDRHE